LVPTCFAELLCEDELCAYDATDKTIALSTCKVLTEQYIAAVGRTQAAPCTISEIIVWSDEAETIQECPVNPKLAGANFTTLQLPLPDIIRELHVVRLARMTTDMLKGATVMAQQGPWSLALLMPACCSLLLQTTADENRAADEKTVTALAASVQPQWMLLHGAVQEALR
jgi:hypothetical protein